MAPVQEQDKQLVVGLAPTAADQLARMCNADEPLWVRQRGAEVMALEEHARMFRCEILLASMNYQGTSM
uniref:START domain-containing protein n=1 Tax=Oryza glaberrima TaxID=4538 RepID=I1PRB8_ORYGL